VAAALIEWSEMATLIVVQDIVWDGKARRGGRTMNALQWLRGLERLGHQAFFLDITEEDPRKHGEGARRWFEEIVSQWWHADHTALLLANTLEPLYGLDAAQVGRLAGEAAAVLTIGVPGCVSPCPLLEQVRPRILVEQDPGYSHLWAAVDSPVEIFGEQDVYFTVGGNIGSCRCSIPTFGIHWRPIWNPIVLDWWPERNAITRDRFTTVASWWSQDYLEFEGKVLGPKAEEFRKFIRLPELTGEEIEIALEAEADDPDIPHLRSRGWRVESPEAVASPALYQDYVAGSLAEFSCAKGVYVGTRCGWFSDRSACYLAAGRPVVLQATGFEHLLPTREGLFAVSTVEEAAEAMKMIRRDYSAHSAAARAIAREHFDSDKVLRGLLADVGL
jgi:hypothetical protein